MFKNNENSQESNKRNNLFNAFSKAHYYLNQNWLRQAYQYSPLAIELAQDSEDQEIMEDVKSNTIQPDSIKDQEVKIPEILSLLNHSQNNSKPFSPLSRVLSNTLLIKQNVLKSSPLFNNGSGILKISLKKFEYDTTQDCLGYIQLYNCAKFIPNSDKIWFTVQKDKIKFTQTAYPYVFFEVNNTPELRFLCVVCIKTGASTVPIAVSVIKLFDSDGFFIQNKCFSKPFVKITDFLTDTIIRAIVSTEVRDPIDINVEIETSLVDSVSDFTFTYSNQNSGHLVVVSRPYSLLFRPPIIYITNFRLIFKTQPKEDLINLKFFVLAVPDGEPCQFIVSPNSPYLEKLFITLSIPSNKEIIFRDELQLFFEGIPTDKMHIVVQISGKSEVIGTAVFMFPTRSGEITANVFEVSQLPEGYLDKPKNKKILLSASVKAPENLTNANQFCHDLATVDWSKFQLETLADNFVPIISNLLGELDFNSGAKLVEFIGLFPADNVVSCLKQWANHFFDPTTNFENIFTKIPIVFSKVLEDYINNQHNPQVVSIPLAFLIECLNVCLKTKGVTQSSSILITLLVMSTNVIIKAVKSNSTNFQNLPTTKLNNSLAEIAVTILEGYDTKVFNDAIYFHIQSLRKANDSTNYSVYLLFRFYRVLVGSDAFCKFSTSKCKISHVESGFSNYLKFLSPLFHFISKSFESDHVTPSILSLILSIISTFSQNAEQYSGEERTRVASALLPLLHIFYTNYDLSIMKKNKEITELVFPSVLFIISYCTPKAIKAFFDSLSTMQIQFMNFLGQILEHIKRGKNLQLLHDATRRILTFISLCQDSFKDLDNSVFEIFRNCFYPSQSKSNYSLIYSVGEMILNFQQHEQRKNVISHCVNLQLSNSKDERSLGIALTLYAFKSDYEKYKSIVVSSTDFMDCLATKLFNCSAAHIFTFTFMLNILKDIASSSEGPYNHPSELSQLVLERINASFVVVEGVVSQRDVVYPVDVNALNLMRIADQYYEMPSMRVKWLRQIVINARLAEDFSSAFVAQMHVVALCSAANSALCKKFDRNEDDIEVLTMRRTSIRERNGDLFLNCDFTSFIPGLEKDLNIKNLCVSADLLQDFTEDIVIAELELAENLCRQACLYQPLYKIHSLLIRGYHNTRDYKSIAEDLKSFSSDCGKATNNIIPPLSYFLLETKDEKMNVKRQVFCLHSRYYQKMPQIIAENGRLPKPPKMCHVHSPQCEKEEGSCLVPIFPIKKDDNFTFFDEFVSEPQFLNQTNSVIYLKTVNPLPFYKMSSDIAVYEMKQVPLEELCEKKVESDIKLLEEAANETQRWIPSPDVYIEQHIEKLPKILQSVINEEMHSGEYLKTLFRFDKETVKKLAEKLAPYMARVLYVYTKSSSGLVSREAHESLIPLNKFAVEQFLGIFGVKPPVINDNLLFVDAISNEIMF
ncbi:hypothetical protein TVAG_482830 [Trichomonas vaginalis G3]|uniref:DOCKER Lobe A domain-containing protein n=1 Tax=Trichomonas vaginalis (strain ATCC PRA-98 / G3) TaxID=412133 RepID=A2FRR8_TRIV3|nr:dedicator of cytokinesis DOCK family [Trichomonas vaginalis G3]EAX92407.1 hypothetical protein TVAG_482830 [Trichomonas vaginalis G3]KAI5551079.1 dedicator of cytokinesis DOCK family [Trichomonas vaginalis G3]|eukprot:XP_001305337.1 hypothetical protein [Trichomonas vaginalis G3]